MRIEQEPRLPINVGSPDYLRNLNVRLNELFKRIAYAINEEKHESTTAPTTGLWAVGNKVWNSAPSELGSASSKYVIIGWVCTVSGEPGTWVEMRTLTGN